VPASEPPAPVRIGRYQVDLVDRRVRLLPGAATTTTDPGDAPTSTEGVHLTPTEWHLLTVLATNPGRLVSQRQLLVEVWGPTYVNESHYLRQYLKHLRRKLEDDPARPRHLITEPGMGYRFQP
jgi:two-component system, OmpR family, KDP operon response regulator KdpE